MAAARPESLFVDQSLDRAIAPLVHALADRWTVTLGSCSGHGRESAYVEFAVHGVEGVRRLVERLNGVRERFAKTAWLNVALNWNQDVVTSCDFETYPEWIMVSLTVERLDGRPPTPALLRGIAAAYRPGRARARG